MDVAKVLWILSFFCLGFCQFVTMENDHGKNSGRDDKHVGASTGNDDKSSLELVSKEMDVIKGNTGLGINDDLTLQKRNNGIWKNQRSQLEQLANSATIAHTLSRRFSDEDHGSLGDGYGVSDAAAYLDFLQRFGISTEEALNNEDKYGDVDKRHASRWNIIHQKLASLSSKRSAELDKRSDSRWRLIQSKLNQLNGITNKRSTNDLGIFRDNDEAKDKRHLGHWKNRNWLNKQYSTNN
ncbi:hypothetical protein MAR_004989 [Mya arenaria]|uniref:Uncharacterized protein n=1 Tax=Mya arenaria TaxID=6604 RepID=A0ABY7F289_MYAAR|nr:uncharacterized protein LOC128203491 [Mya arenaria]WAR14884.1 hypothetical protein MAR_004989 [Mya arenaria]